jgi:hypothetical protein
MLSLQTDVGNLSEINQVRLDIMELARLLRLATVVPQLSQNGWYDFH